MALYALASQDLFGPAKNGDKCFVHLILNLVIAYVLENTKIFDNSKYLIDSKKWDQIYLIDIFSQINACKL